MAFNFSKVSQNKNIKLLQNKGTIKTTNINFKTLDILNGVNIMSPILIKNLTFAYNITIITVFTKKVIPIHTRHYIT